MFYTQDIDPVPNIQEVRWVPAQVWKVAANFLFNQDSISLHSIPQHVATPTAIFRSLCKAFHSVSWEANSSQIAQRFPHLDLETEVLLPLSTQSTTDCYHKHSPNFRAFLIKFHWNFILLSTSYLLNDITFRRVPKISESYYLLRHSSLSLSLSPSPSARMKKLRSQWMGFHGTWCLGIFRKSVHEVLLKSNQNKVYFATKPKDPYDNILLNSCCNKKCSRHNLERQSK